MARAPVAPQTCSLTQLPTWLLKYLEYPREKVGKHLHYFLRKYTTGLTAANNSNCHQVNFRQKTTRLSDSFFASWILRQSCQGYQRFSPQEASQACCQRSLFTLAVRFPISPILQTLRLLPWTPEKDLVVPGIHSHTGEEPIIRHIIQRGFSFLLFSIFSLESE